MPLDVMEEARARFLGGMSGAVKMQSAEGAADQESAFVALLD